MVSRAQRRRAVSLAGATCALLISSAPLPAHSALSNAVEHRNTITITKDNIDVTSELVFSGMPSLMHRRRMDHDGDGLIRADELKRYLDQISDEIDGKLTLRVDGGEWVPLTPLYDPEIDLGGLNAAVPGMFVIRLYHFTPLPAALRTGGRIALSDRLFDDLPSRTSYNLIADQGVGMRIVPSDGFTMQPEETRSIELECTGLPHRPVELTSLKSPDPRHGAASPSFFARGWKTPAVILSMALAVVVIRFVRMSPRSTSQNQQE